eukprot:6172607-Pleurochrysis_carterae.AAC.2
MFAFWVAWVATYHACTSRLLGHEVTHPFRTICTLYHTYPFLLDQLVLLNFLRLLHANSMCFLPRASGFNFLIYGQETVWHAFRVVPREVT